MTWFAAASLYDENRRAMRGMDCCPYVTVSVDEYDYGAAIDDLPNPGESYNRIIQRCSGRPIYIPDVTAENCGLQANSRRPRLESAGNDTPLLGDKPQDAAGAAAIAFEGADPSANYASLNLAQGGAAAEVPGAGAIDSPPRVAAVRTVREPSELAPDILVAIQPTAREERAGVPMGAGRGPLLAG